MVNGEMKDLRNGRTLGERLWLWRTKHGLSQAQAAAKLGLTPKQYWKAEADIKDYPVSYAGKGGRYNLATLCRLARRRHGAGLQGTAKLLGISHTTLLQWESSGEPALVNAWTGLGYRF